MTISSSSSRPDDSRIAPAAADPGVPSLSAHLPMRSAPRLEHLPDLPVQDETTYGDPLDDLVRAAVADRPVEDVVRLITLLERSPEHARTTADALRAAAVGRSVEDVTHLVTLLTELPQGFDSADEAIRTAAEHRPLDDVTRLMRLLHRTPVGPRCGQAAVQAAAVGRPVEELAELIGLLAADRSVHQDPPSEPAPSEPADRLPESLARRPRPAGGTSATASPAGPTASPAAPAASAVAISASAVGAVPGLTDRTWHDRTRNARPASERVAGDEAENDRPVDDRAENERRGENQPGPGRPATGRPVTGRSAKDRHAEDGPVRNDRRRGRSHAVSLWSARTASVLVLLCGIAHFPRYWTGLSQDVLGATVVEAGLCMLLALALPARAAQARLVAATAAVGVTAVLAAGRMLGRFSPPGLARVWDATVAPPWLAGTAATVAALTALAALTATLVTGNSAAQGGH
ncbi:hypothetical protein ACGFT2_08610 [Streptomyces sp. NPDC048514]|uniref:hypothetical protein n=1 Tax=Streptomyces sp. NPDC048514 TaxID=3365564 RepID=UPI00371D5B9D